MFGGLLGPKLPSMQACLVDPDRSRPDPGPPLPPGALRREHSAPAPRTGSAASTALAAVASASVPPPAPPSPQQQEDRLQALQRNHQLQSLQDQQQKQAFQHQLRELIRQETQSVLHVAQQQPRAAPMQLIINNHSEANSDQRTVNQAPAAAPPPPPPPARRDWDEAQKTLASFLASPFNRLCLFSALGLALYVLQGQLSHKWRMAELQRKIDANIFLRLTQMAGGLAPASR